MTEAKATMISFHSPRLAALFGNIPLERLTAEDIEKAVQRSALREDEDLDFKRRLVLDKDEAKAEFAKDVAAFANTRGGLLIVGVRESDGVADGVELLDVDEDFPARLYSAVANWLAPAAEFGVHFAPTVTNPKRGFYLITVPRSPSAPHAVRMPQAKNAWRFPRRASSDTLFMSESEVADAYRSRFRGMEEQSSRLKTVLGNGLLRLHPEQAWASMVLVPNAQGRLPLDQKVVRALATWAAGVRAIPPNDGPFEDSHIKSASTRAGRVTLSAHPRQEVAEQRPYAELYADGSGFASMPLSFLGDPRSSVPIHAVSLIRLTYGLVNLLVGHATQNIGVVGDAICAFELRGPVVAGGNKPMILTYHSVDFPEMVDGSRPLLTVPVSPRTVSLSALMDSAQERVATTHMLLSDVFAEFGVPEGRYLASDGTLRLRMWRLAPDQRNQIEAWAKQFGIPTSFEDVGD